MPECQTKANLMKVLEKFDDVRKIVKSRDPTIEQKHAYRKIVLDFNYELRTKLR